MITQPEEIGMDQWVNNYNPSVQKIIETDSSSALKKKLVHFVGVFNKRKENSNYQETCQLTVKLDNKNDFFDCDQGKLEGYMTFGLPRSNLIMGSDIVQ